MRYTTLDHKEINDGMNLVKEVFFGSQNLGLSREASKSFLEFLSLHARELKWIGAYEHELQGVLAYEPQASHIALLFVRKEEQRKGIAGGLFHQLLSSAKDAGIQRITVNALPQAAVVYEHLGFEKAADVNEAGGMQYVLMEYMLGKENLGRVIDVTIDHPYGSMHPHIPDLFCTCNYGYFDDSIEQEFQNVYVYGVQEPLDKFHGTVIAVIYHRDEPETRWIAASGTLYDKTDVINAIGPMEEDFDVRIEWL